MTALLILIYIAFISLGIPDSLLGAAWPAMHKGLGVGISLAGVVSIVIACGTVVSSLLSARLIARYGTGKVTAFSVLATAVALLGFSLSPSFALTLLFAVPLGLGAGAVDSGLNNFVALHYQAKHMNWLHSFWGIGATISPALIGALLAATGSWRSGYFWMAVVQGVLVVALFLTLPLWKRAKAQESHHEEKTKRALPLRKIIARPLAKPVFLALLCYCGAESTVGLWGASYLVGARAIKPDVAAMWVSAFYAGIMLGRFLAGLLTFRWNNPQMIRMGQGCALVGVGLIFLGLPTWILPIALFMIGMGFAPIFPAILHQTPRTFGSDISQDMMGVEMAFAYVGNICVPPLFGWMSSIVGLQVLPVYIALLIIGMLVCMEYVRKRAANMPNA